MTTSVIKAIQPNGSWESKYGTMYSFKVSFEDGVTLEANSKSQEPPYKVGDTMVYEITNDDPKFGAKGKVKSPESAANGFSGGGGRTGGDRDAIICKQTALKCAAEYHAQRQSSPDAVIEDAQKFFDWLMNKPAE